MDYSGELKVVTSKGESEVSIQFEDNGCGMDEDELERIFKPFVSGRKGQSNVGLGLSVTKNIIHSHKGKLFVESEKGIGSTFTIKLPIE